MKKYTIIILIAYSLTSMVFPATVGFNLYSIKKVDGTTGIQCVNPTTSTDIAGYTSSFGNYNGADVWLIKRDNQGIQEWNQIFEGSSYEEGYSVEQTSDGGYIITGYTQSLGNGYQDFLLIKTDSQGNTVDWPE